MRRTDGSAYSGSKSWTFTGVGGGRGGVGVGSGGFGGLASPAACSSLFAGSSTVLAIALLRIPFLDTTLGVSAGATQFTLTMAGLLLDVRRLTSRNQ